MHKLPTGEQVGGTSYSGVRSLRGLLIGHGCAKSHVVRIYEPPPLFSMEETLW